ncbi:hypothetical protein [Brevibacillus dissolubilis]|uniref:hypothetical protein n=1 Tax=Brevibacillus dissolubilis TaxID=1844116 RepID=UPI0011164281|nr:hypothetical protein [Brevibacillus dissolubilis]
MSPDAFPVKIIEKGCDLVRRNFSYILIISVLLLISCSPADTEVIQDNQSKTSTLDSIFKEHYSEHLFKVGNITKELTEADSQDDLLYIKGMADGFLQGNPASLPHDLARDPNEFNKIVEESLQEEILNLYANEKKYVAKIKEILDTSDVTEVQKMKNVFSEIYNLERNLNVNDFSLQKADGKYKENIKKLNVALIEFSK